MTNMTEIQNMLDEGVGTEHISRCFEFSFSVGIIVPYFLIMIY